MPKSNQIFNAISELLGSDLEISIFKDSKIEHTINSLSSNKSDTELPKNIQFDNSKITELSNGKTVKEIYTQALKKTIRLRYDISQYKELQKKINSIFYEVSDNVDKWKNQIDSIIQKYINDKKINIDALKKEEKIEITNIINEHSLLEFKESTSYIANILKVSRATIYNYISWSKSLDYIDAHQVNSFVEKGYEGNPAGVIFNAQNLSKSHIKKIAKSLNLSETVFVNSLNSNTTPIEASLQYITRNGTEVDFCGHSTIAAIYMLNEIKPLNGKDLIISTNLGKINGGISKDENIHYTNPPTKTVAYNKNIKNLLEALNIDKKNLLESTKFTFEKNNKDLFFMIDSKFALDNISPNFKNLEKYCVENNIVAICIISDSDKNHIDYCIRCFCPAVGVNEDPVTGSISAGLVDFLTYNNQLNKNKIKIEQGSSLNQSGIININIDNFADKTIVTTFAKAQHFSSSKLLIQQMQEK